MMSSEPPAAATAVAAAAAAPALLPAPTPPPPVPAAAPSTPVLASRVDEHALAPAQHMHPMHGMPPATAIAPDAAAAAHMQLTPTQMQMAATFLPGINMPPYDAGHAAFLSSSPSLLLGGPSPFPRQGQATAASVTAAALAARAAGTLQQKMCNCKNSKCLKLYCECFSAGLPCVNCNCRDCLNRPEHADRRTEAMDTILERSPFAFQPKIATSTLVPRGARGRMVEMDATLTAAGTPVRQVHNKGCNCRKSHCMKKYCECFQAGISCGEHCRCTDCKNMEGSRERMVLDARRTVVGAMSPNPYATSPAASAFLSHVHSHAHAHSATTGAASTLTPRQFLEQQVANYSQTTTIATRRDMDRIEVSTHIHAPWGELLSNDMIKQLTRHLFEAAAHETLVQQQQQGQAQAAQKEQAVADTLLSMHASPRQVKGEAEHGDGDGEEASFARSRRSGAPPSSKKSLFGRLSTPAAAASSSSTTAASPTRGNSDVAPRPVPDLFPASEPFLRPSSTPLTIHKHPPGAMGSLYSARARAHPGSDAEASTDSSAHSTSIHALPAAIPAAPMSQHSAQILDHPPPSQEGKKRAREGEEAATDSDDGAGEGKRVKIEIHTVAVKAEPVEASDATPAAAAALPNPMSGRPSSPHTDFLLCDESDLASAPQLHDIVQAELRLPAATAAAASAAPSVAASPPSPSCASALSEPPAGGGDPLERVQERVLLDETASVLSLLVQRMSKDRERMKEHDQGASIAHAHAVPG